MEIKTINLKVKRIEAFVFLEKKLHLLIKNKFMNFRVVCKIIYLFIDCVVAVGTSVNVILNHHHYNFLRNNLLN